MENPVLLLRNVARTLKPQGRIGIIDYRRGRRRSGPGCRRARSSERRRRRGGAAGLKLVEQHHLSALPVLPDLRQVTDDMRIALTIAGSDSSGRRRRAGGPEDIRRARRLRRVGDHSRHVAKHHGRQRHRSRCLRRSCDRRSSRSLRTSEISAVKTGMLATAEIVQVVAETVGRLQRPQSGGRSRSWRRERTGGGAPCWLRKPSQY